MKRPISILFILLMGLMAAFSQTKRSHPYQNPKLPTEQRVKDLLGRMSLHEKILQLQHLQGVPGTGYRDGNSYGCVVNTGLSADQAATAYAELQKYMQDSTRWGIPVLTCTEALHGAVQGNCTISLGSTFNPELVRRMAESVSRDLKAMHI